MSYYHRDDPESWDALIPPIPSTPTEFDSVHVYPAHHSKYEKLEPSKIPVTVVMGIVLMIVQTTLSLLGMTMIRLAHIRYQEVDRGLVSIDKLHFSHRPLFLRVVGLTLFIGSQILMPFALALAPMSLLAPLSCVQIIINLLMCFAILDEVIARRDIICTVLSGLFALGVLFFGPRHNDPNITYVTDIFSQMTTFGWAYVGSMLGLTALCLALYKFQHTMPRQKYFVIPYLHVSLASFGLLFTKGLGNQLIEMREIWEHGGHMGSAILQLLLTGAGIALCSPGAMYFQVIATREFDNRWFIPVRFALGVVLQLFLGAAAFNEWEHIAPIQIFLFLFFSLGCVLSVIGISGRNTLEEKLNAQVATKDARQHVDRTVDLNIKIESFASPKSQIDAKTPRLIVTPISAKEGKDATQLPAFLGVPTSPMGKKFASSPTESRASTNIGDGPSSPVSPMTPYHEHHLSEGESPLEIQPCENV